MPRSDHELPAKPTNLFINLSAGGIVAQHKEEVALNINQSKNDFDEPSPVEAKYTDLQVMGKKNLQKAKPQSVFFL